MPDRVQLSRRGGWRMPANTKKVDRSTKWGNPYDLMTVFEELQGLVDRLPDPLAVTELRSIGWNDAEEFERNVEAFKSISRCYLLEIAAVWAVYRFKCDLTSGALEVTVEDVQRELAGFNLACWCPPPKAGDGVDVCHARVLLEVANG